MGSPSQTGPRGHRQKPASAADIRRAAKELFLAGGGECGALMRATEWYGTTLGPVVDWPPGLRTAIRIVLTSRQPMFIWWGPDLINLYNDAYRDILGNKHPRAMGRPAQEVWKEIWDQVGPRARTAMESNTGTYDEALLLIMHRHGYPEETYFTFSYSPIPGEGGEPGGIICANTDDTRSIISERQMATLREVAARSGDGRSRQDACQLAAGALTTNRYDIPFALLYTLDAAGRRLELAGSTGLDGKHAAAPQHASAGASKPWPFAEALRLGRPRLVSNVGTRFRSLPTGQWDEPPGQAVVVPIPQVGSHTYAGIMVVGLNPYRPYDEDYESFIHLVAGEIGTSIANASAYEEERRRAEALTELDRARTSFFSNVSHEFRTPLTLILGPLEEVLYGGEAGAAAGRRQLEVAYRNGLRLQKLVNNLLDFSRIEAGRVQALYVPTDLPSFTADLASNFRSAVEKAGMRFDIDMPPLDEPAYVDREMWEKIVFNLLSNAFKYTLHGSIGVHLSHEDGNFVLRVSDTGVGIRKSDQSKLFERFHRVPGVASRTHEGTGIGLALVKELVAQHGGSVAVESRLGKGTTFTISIPGGSGHLPADHVVHEQAPLVADKARQYVEEVVRWLPEESADDDMAGDAGAAEPPAPVPARSSGKPARILLADDNADMRRYVEGLLGRHYTVRSVADGRQAAALVHSWHPDLILTDVMMPKMDGISLLRHIRSSTGSARIPVVLLSARAGEEATLEGVEAGADDYLVKPFSARELLARVATHIRNAQIRSESERRLHDLLMQSPAGIAIMRGPEHHYELVNQRYRELVAALTDERQFIGKTVREALPRLDGQGFFKLLDEVYATGKTYVGTEMPATVVADGTKRQLFLNFVYQPIRDTDTVTGIFVHAVDVTAQVVARHKAEASEAKMRFMAASMPHKVITTTPDGKLDYLSPQWEAYTGLSAKQLSEPKNWEGIIHPDDSKYADSTWQQALATHVPAEMEFRLRDRNGEYRWHISRVVPMFDDQGGVMMWIASSTDIDEYKRALRSKHELEVKTAMLTEQREQLMALNQAKDDFISLASHQLRTPATGVKQYLGMLLQGYVGALSDEQKAFLHTAYDSNERQITIVNDLLQVAQMDAGKVRLQPARTDMVKLVTGILDEQSSRFVARDQKVVFRPAAGRMIAWVDEDRIRMVLENIIDNAGKYTYPGKAVTVTMRLVRQGLAIAVRDQGVGMEKDDIDKIFSKFTRLDNPLSTSAQGSGLGLYWAKKIVDLHAGRIRVRSTPGKGTTFTVILPTSSSHRA